MKFAIAATLLSLVGFVASAAVPRQSCPEASRFGVISVTPSTVSPGDEIIVTVDLTCAINSFDIIPKYLDYTIEVSSASNAIKPPISVPPILLARRDFPAGATSDVFTTQVD
ncbi:hypothetical protein C0991_011832 [Blastosporella zonata]|nr:hypothetical protein C0991_011832 [Blastosporella zonata]